MGLAGLIVTLVKTEQRAAPAEEEVIACRPHVLSHFRWATMVLISRVTRCG